MYENVFCICQSFVTVRLSNSWHDDLNYIFIQTLLCLATAVAAIAAIIATYYNGSRLVFLYLPRLLHFLAIVLRQKTAA